jgi:tRNA-uridine 2-sulfurtransferase
MSGGVDSSVAAALLVQKKFEVVGLTMCFNLSDGEGAHPSCCGVQAIEDARRVASALGIRHYVLNMQRHLNDKVIADFLSEYSLGRTPNPCVRCNQFVKFEALLAKAQAIGATHLATGHYARIVRRTTNRFLARGKDPRKDQSYFIYRAGQKELSRLMFPIGAFTKSRIRELARSLHLPVAEKPDSQEICFLPDNDYRSFLRRRGYKAAPGPIRTVEGRIVGRHQGVAFYTIGQREGLGVALGKPAYVVSLDAASHTVVVGTREQASSRECLVSQVHFSGEPFKKKVALDVKIRYNHPQAPAEVVPGKGSLKVIFKTPQFAVTPGQSAVFYRQDIVVGGGIIEKVI